MSKPALKVELEEGQPWAPDSPAFFSVHIRSVPPSENSVRITLEASFTPFKVSQGVVVKSELAIGCTGARFGFRTDCAEITNYTTGKGMTVNSTRKWTSENTASLTPTASLKIGGIEGQAELGTFQRGGTTQYEVSVQAEEFELVATPVGRTAVYWSYDLHRGEKVVRDYLECTLPLSAETRWDSLCNPVFWTEGRPTDRRFFKPDRRPLGRTASLGLLAKLQFRNIDLPSIKPIRHKISIEKTTED